MMKAISDFSRELNQYHLAGVGVRMKPLVTVALLSLCSVIIGCGPVSTVSRYGVKATLVDVGSKKPVARTKTRITVDGATSERVSSRQGAITAHANRQWHLSWLGGPAWMSDPDAEIEIEPHGYQKFTLKWDRYLKPNSTTARIPQEDGIIDLGTIEVKKR